MMLWDIIRDFFVRYIFGGVSSDGSYSFCYLGYIHAIDQNGLELDSPFYTNTTFIKLYSGNLGDVYEGQISDFNGYISMGDWLSTTATIITLCAICVFLFFFVRWLFRLTAGLISGRG